jgi:hypothetical protein
MLGSVAPALALDFSPHPNNRSPTLTAVLATGEITAGDADRLSAYLVSLPRKKNTAIYLSSTGGDLHEAMRLGRLFRERGIKTVVEGNSDCVSACALAFLGGTDNQGKPWRSSTTSSRLGFHAFRSATGEATPSDEVQRVVAEMLLYGQDVNAPIELLIVGFSTPSQEMFYISNPDVCALGIKLWSVEGDRFLCND